MSAIDDLILALKQGKYSSQSQTVEAPIDTFVLALQAIQAGLTPAGNETANTFYAGPAAAPAALPTFRAMVNADLPAAMVVSTSLRVGGAALSAGAVVAIAGAGAGSVQIGAVGGLTPDYAGISFDGGTTFSIAGSPGDNALYINAHSSQLNFQVGGNLIAHVDGTKGLTVDAALSILWANKTLLVGQITDGNLAITNNAFTGFGLLQLGGVTNAFPAIKRNATALNVRLADDSADAAITALRLTSSDGNLAASSAAYASNPGAQVATLTNGPTAGNPTKWIPINDNGTTRNIPAW